MCDELERIYPATGNVYQRFRDSFNPVVSKVLGLAREKCPYFRFFLEAKEEALTEDLPGITFFLLGVELTVFHLV